MPKGSSLSKGIKDHAITQVVVASVAFILSLVGLTYQLVVTEQVMPSKITVGVLGAWAGFASSAAAYWLVSKRERKQKFIFLSYSLRDKQIAKRIEFDLRKDGFQVFDIASSTNVGESITEKIEKALSRTNFLILLMSQQSAESPWIKKEVDYALSHGIKILPVATTKDPKVPIKIADLKYVSVQDSYDEAYNHLKRAIAAESS